jgi:hypothetical protein
MDKVGGVTPLPDRVTEAPAPPVRLTDPRKVAADVGVNPTVTVWLCPADKVYEPPETIE